MDAKTGYIALGAIVGAGLLVAIPIATIHPTKPESFSYTGPAMQTTTARVPGTNYAPTTTPQPTTTTATDEPTTTTSTGSAIDISPATDGGGGYVVSIPSRAQRTTSCDPATPGAVLVMTPGRTYTGVVCLTEYDAAQIGVKAPIILDGQSRPLLETYGTLAGRGDRVYHLRSLRAECMPRTIGELLNRGCVHYPS